MMKFFRQDVALLFFVSIFLGTFVARTISFAADAYFKETMTGIVGEYGEYDLLLQLREENKAEAMAELERILQQEFGGAKLKEGPTLVQKVNVFVALPRAAKNRELYETVEKRFASIPGGVGVSIITEPRLNVRGLPAGLLDGFLDGFGQMEGVAFVYRSGGNLGIVVDDARKLQRIQEEVEKRITNGKLLEVSFTKGAEPANQQQAAERIVRLLRDGQGIDCQYVSLDKNSDDLEKLLSVVQEVRDFLQAYQTKVFITSDRTLEKGEQLVLPTKRKNPPTEGEPYDGQAVAVIDYLKQSGVYQAVLVQGDSEGLLKGEAHVLEEKTIGAPAGFVNWHNPRQTLTAAADGAAKAVGDLPKLRAFSRVVSEEALRLFDGYEANQPLLRRTIGNMETARNILVHSAEKLQPLSGGELSGRLNSTIRSIDNLVGKLRVVGWFSQDAAQTAQTLRDIRVQLAVLRNLMDGSSSLSEEAQRTGAVLGAMQQDLEEFNRLLGGMKRDELQYNLQALEQAVAGLDTEKSKDMIESLQLLESNLPLLRDDDIAAALRVLDKMLQGKTLPDSRVQFKVARYTDKESVRPLIAQALDRTDFGLFEAELGVIEPNIYAQAYQILSEVHSVLAALASLVAVAVFLALDHTAVAAALKWRYGEGRGIRRLFSRGNLYAMAAGASLWGSIYVLSGAAIPYVPLPAVFVCGALLGLLFGMAAEKFSPLDREEILAAESLGIGFDDILREIVIPEGRPGLLARLNRFRQKFK